jgi:hypothetical protein
MATDFQPPAGPPWGAPQPGYYPAVPPPYTVPTAGLAVASLVCSLIGLFTLGLGSVPGIVLGYFALPETRSGRRYGHGLAVAGLVIGWVQAGCWLMYWLFIGLGGLLAGLGGALER